MLLLLVVLILEGKLFTADRFIKDFVIMTGERQFGRTTDCGQDVFMYIYLTLLISCAATLCKAAIGIHASSGCPAETA